MAGGHAHSGLHRRMLVDFMESELGRELAVAGMLAHCSTLSHPEIDLTKALQSVKSHRMDILASVDYIGRGRTGKDFVNDERKEFVSRYLEMRKKALKDRPTDVPKTPDELQITPV